MPEPRERSLVTNTTRLIALTAATGGLEVQTEPVVLQAYLHNTMDKGEAAVIQTALNLGLPLVCIDEAAGRRIARLCDLRLTGSIGILLKARSMGFAVDIPQALDRMRRQGIWLSDRLVQFALSN